MLVANGKVFSAHYVSTIQNGWKSKADRGIPFTQIMQEQYQGEGAQLIKCDGEDESTDTPISDETGGEGTVPSSKYPEKAPNQGVIQGFAYNDEPEVKLIDFGFSRKYSSKRKKRKTENI